MKKTSMLNHIKIVQYIKYYSFGITKHQNKTLPTSKSKFLRGTVKLSGKTSIRGCQLYHVPVST